MGHLPECRGRNVQRGARVVPFSLGGLGSPLEDADVREQFLDRVLLWSVKLLAGCADIPSFRISLLDLHDLVWAQRQRIGYR